MASILDEYEDSLSRSAVLQPGCPSVGIPHSANLSFTPHLGYVNAQLEKEVPIFTKQRIDFTPSERITSLVVSCNQLCMSLGKDTLLRIDLGKANEPNHMELGRKDDAKVHKMFLDHTGSHLLIALSSTEVLYVNRNGQKVRPLARWKGQLVESVGWNKALGTETSTGPILVGTAQGQIFEAEISASEGGLFGPAPDLYFRPLYVLNEEGGPAPVCSLEAERGPEGRGFVIATTRQRLFQFIGRAAEGAEVQGFSGLFAAYTDHPPPFREFPSSLGYSELAFYTPKLRSAPRAFAWMMGDGVLYGSLDCGRPDSLLSEERVWEYPDGFHFLLLLADRVEAVCTLTGQVVLRDHFLEKFGPLKHMREARDVWRTYLDMNRFDLAKEYCRERPDCLDTSYFEEIALKFLEARQEEALAEFLQRKLASGALCQQFASRASIHELLASHGDTEHMVYFAVIMQDYERVVAYHCQHEAYEEALAVLARHRDPQLFYKFSPILIRHIPRHQGGEAQQVSQAIRYMEFCVNAGASPHRVLELYEEAVDLALQVDVDLAKQCADLPEEDEELRKKLWLKIARHVVQEEEDVQTAMACLASCPLLKIEDVLPFFPDFVTIDHFKEAICSSLKAYNHHIQELQREMEEATASAQRIRRDLQELRGRYGTVEPQDKSVRPGLPAYKQARLEELQRKLGAAPPPAKGSTRAKEAEGGAAAGGPSREQLKADLDELRYEEEHLSWL
ncbi:vacuolar protein sorting-associated protein 18-like protein [Camelus ferus]|nr:vacuolar protein sorting-associated protein 18-like protein [Camelus ferus]